MKWIALTVVALLVCVAVSVALVQLLARRTGRPRSKAARVGLSALVAVLLVAIVCAGYLGVYYHADAAATEALAGTRDVRVERIDEGWLFDGPGDEVAMVFFPGAKVEAQAYAPLMGLVAERGIDCYLVDPPLRFAMFGTGAAEDIMAGGGYDRWILGGHSLGGTVAANVAEGHATEVSGLVLLASYPTGQVAEGVTLLSAYGSSDELLNLEAYGQGRDFWPASSTEMVIDGGNHAGFGCYGPQSGDGEATIPPEEQQVQTADAIAGAFL